VIGPARNFREFLATVSIALVATFAAGCATSQKAAKKPASAPIALLTSNKTDLVAQYNQQARNVKSINAAVTMTLIAGSAYTGLIKQYHQVNGFILAQQPADIRVIGQVPVVGTNIFDMVSDGETFHIFIPSRNEFITGPARLERASAKPIENLRPQHLTRAIFWAPIPPNAPVLFEEAGDTSDVPARYYVLTVVGGANSSASAASEWQIAQKIWFDRADLHVSRIETYDPAGEMLSDTRYSNWDSFGTGRYPRQIAVNRPANDYELQIHVVRLTLNETVSADRFVLQQPPRTQLVRVGDEPPVATAPNGQTPESKP
jgi:outer membrane lipoprotein-sorting protein